MVSKPEPPKTAPGPPAGFLPDLADRIPNSRVFAERLLTDPLAPNVWRVVRQEAEKQFAADAEGFVRRLEALDLMLRAETWWPDCPYAKDVRSTDYAVAAVFIATILLFSIAVVEPPPGVRRINTPNDPVLQSGIEQETASWRAAADKCTEARFIPMGRIVTKREDKALVLARSILLRHAKAREGAKTGPAVIKTTLGEDVDVRRVQVRRLALTTTHLFGSALALTVARLVNIAGALENPVTQKEVQGWLASRKVSPNFRGPGF